MKAKKIRFDYFQVQKAQDNEDGSVSIPLFNLSPVLERLMDLDSTERTYFFDNEQSRLQTVKKYEIDHRICWELQFIRIRESVLPGIATKSGEFHILDLDEDEFIGEEVSALYDEKMCLLVLQRNRNSLSRTGIEKFFNTLLDSHYEIGIISVPGNRNVKFKSSNLFRSITLSLSDVVSSSVVDETSGLGRIVHEIKELHGVTATISISLGSKAKKKDTLSGANTVNLINAAKESSSISRLQVSKKENEDSRVEYYDLIDETFYDFKTLSYDREQPISHVRVFGELESSFKQKLERLERCIRTK